MHVISVRMIELERAYIQLFLKMLIVCLESDNCLFQRALFLLPIYRRHR